MRTVELCFAADFFQLYEPMQGGGAKKIVGGLKASEGETHIRVEGGVTKTGESRWTMTRISSLFLSFIRYVFRHLRQSISLDVWLQQKSCSKPNRHAVCTVIHFISCHFATPRFQLVIIVCPSDSWDRSHADRTSHAWPLVVSCH